MNKEKTLAWFDAILGRTIPTHEEAIMAWSARPSMFDERPRSRNEGRVTDTRYDVEAINAWFTEAHVLLDSVFPPTHAIVHRWKALAGRVAASPHDLKLRPTVAEARGILQAARALVDTDHLRTFAREVRGDTIAAVLEQAVVLCGEGRALAAMVLAGGALETHLRALCDANGLTWTGDGSISKYDGAIAAARNAGTVKVYDAADTKAVTGWGALRNAAAHRPTEFSRGAEEMRTVVAAIAEFVRRTG